MRVVPISTLIKLSFLSVDSSINCLLRRRRLRIMTTASFKKKAKTPRAASWRRTLLLPLLLLQLVPHPPRPPWKDVEDERLYQFYAIVCGGSGWIIWSSLCDIFAHSSNYYTTAWCSKAVWIWHSQKKLFACYVPYFIGRQGFYSFRYHHPWNSQ